ncbi:hypothetical protein PVAND_000828 [Polypedilum vanderplanki]|uniref:Spaetzle domain-containing protein n=1 Tax=Polypedilum vanderplanki TaxID=319348 RepID=A0A9J6BLQ7_POLVA|nr:hypothetical protein PVAND_000828 [Polypedilum vanderplanki]
MSCLNLLFLITLISTANAADCNFEYQENVDNYPSELIDSIVESENLTNPSEKGSAAEFFCLDDEFELDDREKEKSSTDIMDRRIEYSEIEPDEDECEVRKRTIRPKSLTNILNEMSTIVNGLNFIQEINIEECVKPKHKCREDEPGKLCLCFQKYMIQTLRAFVQIIIKLWMNILKFLVIVIV